ncbi:MAG: hypothetical protein JNK93_13150, partial [Planctomycetia bacterium]|nr:hypothetical protein [Planctomycetia bacterium]
MPARTILFLTVWIAGTGLTPAQDKPYAGAACARPVDDFFKDDVWGKVGSQKCLTCHQKGGDAEESQFILKDIAKLTGEAKETAHRQNRDAFATMAERKHKDQSRLLLKVVGELDHGGDAVLKADSEAYKILAKFVGRVNAPAPALAIDPKAPPFFEGVAMAEPRKLLRRATLSLAGRLPTEAEL